LFAELQWFRGVSWQLAAKCRPLAIASERALTVSAAAQMNSIQDFNDEKRRKSKSEHPQSKVINEIM
jgi:hypothetical protein